MKLVKKTRIGSKVKKEYDMPKTPYRRLMDSTYVSKAAKAKLTREYKAINPAELKRTITRLIDRLFEINLTKASGIREEETPPTLSSTFLVRQRKTVGVHF